MRIPIFRPCAARPLEHGDPAVILFNPHKTERCKEMSKTIRTSALVLLLACSAQAGIMQNDAPAPPPPPPSQPANSVQEPTNNLQETSANGYMQTGAPDGLTQIALEMLAVMPSLF